MAIQDTEAEERGAPSVLPQKRILPARERRESAAKRQASSPNTTPKSASTPKKSRPTSKSLQTKCSNRKALPAAPPTRTHSTQAADGGLPTKVTDSKPLPTSYQPQPSRLSTKEYQTIAESAVLAASLHRSRLRWLVDGIFDKYWTKPSKKKGTEGLTSNPDLKTMQKLGSSAIIIGPHTFEATVYTVRDNLAYRHPNQYPQRPVAPQPGFQNYITQSTNLHAPHDVHQTIQMPQDEVKHEKGLSGATASLSTQTSKIPRISQLQPSASPASQPMAKQSKPDPVIPLLATRAANNPGLKALMKVVASSKASPEQLKLFQSHIDELNVMIRQQQEPKISLPESHNSQTDQALLKPAQLDGPPGDMSQITHPPQDGESRSLHHPAHPQQSQPGLAGKVGPLGPPLNAPPYLQYPPRQQKVPNPEPRIKAIVLEFTTPMSSAVSASQDRYLFPEYAVLDTPLSGQGLQMICSFFIVRKGSELLALQSLEETTAGSPASGLTHWNANQEYYQPVTLTMKTSQHRILETIARSAKPLVEVQNKMKEIMQSKTRVADEWLVMRLPREKGVSVEGSDSRDRGFVDSGVEIEDGEGSGNEDEELKAFYGI